MKNRFGLMFFLLLVFSFFLPTQSIQAQENGDFLADEGIPPLGANNPSCQPDADHPTPIVLVHGTFESMLGNWSTLAPLLAEKGYCVYALNYGFTPTGGYGTGAIEDSAAHLSDFVDNVLELTGAEKVSIVGHSQGGMMPRYYIKFLGGAKKVDDLIGLAPSNHGTEGFYKSDHLTNAVAELTQSVALRQQLTGSEFMTNLNQGDETLGNVSYTVISTKYDGIVTPYKSQFLNGPTKQVTNIELQDYYPFDFANHISLSFDYHAYRFVLDALAHKGPATP